MALSAYLISSDRLLVDGFLAHYACQAFIAVVMAVLLFSLYRTGRRAIMAYWGVAWIAQMVYLACAGLALWSVVKGAPADGFARVSIGAVSLAASGAQIYCMLKGWLSLRSGRRFRVRRVFLVLLLIGACGTGIAYVLHRPDFASDERFKIKVCVRSVILGAVYLYIAFSSFSKRHQSRAVHYSLSLALLMVGARYMYYGLVTWFHQGTATYESEFLLQFVDIIGHVLLGTSMMLWVSAEHYSRSVLQSKELEHRAELLSAQDARLAQKQRLESIGRIASGVAHDFNNLLTVILGWTEIMRNESKLDQTAVEGVEGIATAAKQAGSMTQQLLLYGGKQVLQPVLEDPARIIDEVCSMARSLEARNLLVEVADGLPLIRVDRTHLIAALQNLVVNAIDATSQGGTIRVTAASVSYRADGEMPSAIESGNYVKIAVEDDGRGVANEHMAKIFEPFFSTKDMGNGLGLASAQGFAMQSGGSLEVESEVGCGTTFTLLLPAATAESPPLELDMLGVKAAAAVPKSQKQVVVLVDDHAAIVRYANRVLTHAGYQTICAHNAESCLAAVAESQEDPGLLVTDVIMPKVSGTELAERMLKKYPLMGVVFMSGYADSTAMQRFDTRHAPVLLQKPVAAPTLLQAVADHFARVDGEMETA